MAWATTGAFSPRCRKYGKCWATVGSDGCCTSRGISAVRVRIASRANIGAMGKDGIVLLNLSGRGDKDLESVAARLGLTA